jgi:CheY-specific phosphatase CheX
VFDEIRKGAIAVTSNIFETMLFTCLDPQEEGPEEPSLFKSFSMYLMGEIEFTGKYKGSMKLFLPLEMAKRMAAQFMGLEDEKASEAQSMDTVRELCNMIGGNLSSLLDRESAWNLTIPQTRPVSYQEMGEETNREGMKVDFDAEGEGIRLYIQVN